MEYKESKKHEEKERAKKYAGEKYKPLLKIHDKVAKKMGSKEKALAKFDEKVEKKHAGVKFYKHLHE